MRIAGALILLSAILHVVGVVLAGFPGLTAFFLGVAVFYCCLALGLFRGMMVVAWAAFICMLGGAAGALAELVGGSAVPAPILWGILAADVAAALLLFGAIWAGRRDRVA